MAFRHCGNGEKPMTAYNRTSTHKGEPVPKRQLFRRIALAAEPFLWVPVLPAAIAGSRPYHKADEPEQSNAAAIVCGHRPPPATWVHTKRLSHCVRDRRVFMGTCSARRYRRLEALPQGRRARAIQRGSYCQAALPPATWVHTKRLSHCVRDRRVFMSTRSACRHHRLKALPQGR